MVEHVLQDFTKAERGEIEFALQVGGWAGAGGGACWRLAGTGSRVGGRGACRVPHLSTAARLSPHLPPHPARPPLQETIDVLRAVMTVGMERAVSGVRVDAKGAPIPLPHSNGKAGKKAKQQQQQDGSSSGGGEQQQQRQQELQAPAQKRARVGAATDPQQQQQQQQVGALGAALKAAATAAAATEPAGAPQ